MKTELKNWRFAKDRILQRQAFIRRGVSGRAVTVPHTWSVDSGLETYCGTGWYSCNFNLSALFDFNILRFEAAYRDVSVYVNGKKAFEHKNSGYTPFESDITRFLTVGKNTVTVSCSNRYSADALPYRKAFDWANDGGLTRNVFLLQKNKTDIKNCILQCSDFVFENQTKGDTVVSARLTAYGSDQSGSVLFTVVDAQGACVASAESGIKNGEVSVRIPLNGAVLWTPDNPYLYKLRIQTQHEQKDYRFGVRELKTEGGKILLNGEEIVLRGVEWMPGSHPDYGMAEPQDIAVSFLEKLKKIHCNFTRFHWQQPDFVYDWCDEHGLMVQEEIPYWGSPKAATKKQLQCAQMQAREMLHAHRNHPSIVCWGVGNELGGERKETIRYVQQMVSYIKNLDATRLVNYVSSSLHAENNPQDATCFGDICMWNDYLGFWYKNLTDLDKWISYVKNKCGEKPLVISEAGLCEPFFKGGDERRSALYKEREALYLKYHLNGWIYFSLNDYRTHVGEQGSGRLKCRVHGSTDLYGAEKPSLQVLQTLFSENILTGETK